MNKTSNKKEKRLRGRRMVKKIGEFGGWGGKRRHIYEFTETSNVVSSHSCLLPKFSITLRVGELRRLLANLKDDAALTVTVIEQQASQFTYVR